MKEKKLIRQFQFHMLITVIIIAGSSIAFVLGARKIRKMILPNESEMVVTVKTTYADGSKDIALYDMEIGKTYESSAELPYDDIPADDIPADEQQSKPLQLGSNYTISKLQKKSQGLTPKRRWVYETLGLMIYIVPVLISLFGVIFSCFLFYRRRIKPPVTILDTATKNIANSNLDFEISSECNNELGRLCGSFEKMRAALVQNNQEMLEMLEERRYLQASVAHDLRNPIAIMKGYLEMMENDISEGDKSNDDKSNGDLREEISILSNTIERMEAYVKSVSKINHIGDMELKPKEENVRRCVNRWEQDISMLVQEKNVQISFEKSGIEKYYMDAIKIDYDAISRVLENIINNSCRFANSKISIAISIQNENTLSFDISDDGPGYPEKLLKNPDLFFYTTDNRHEHMGMGMSVCRIICKKHRGRIKISNNPTGGARTIAEFGI